MNDTVQIYTHMLAYMIAVECAGPHTLIKLEFTYAKQALSIYQGCKHQCILLQAKSGMLPFFEFVPLGFLFCL